eukprot:m.18312 g.18312  ORF g.18312 m.18312 type:complete len:495 (+) comp6279_c0_seq1:248-1732(+)
MEDDAPATQAQADEFGATQEQVGSQELSQNNEPWGFLFPVSNHARIELIPDVVIIGRHEACTYQLKHLQISNKHCKLFREKPSTPESEDYIFYIEDLGSTNGTYVNDRQLEKKKPVVIAHNDTIRLTKEGKTAPCFKFYESKEENVGTVSEKYVVKQQLGAGANGTVRIAVHRQTGIKVAIKTVEKRKIKTLLDKNPGTPLTEENLQEISIVRNLKHANIVAVHEMIEDKTQVHIVMDLAGGGDLFDRVVSRKYLPEDQCKWIFVQLLQGVAYLHSRNITHRDLKPENILLENSNARCLIKIADFGLAKAAGPSSLMKTTCGTPCYQAPEIYREEISLEKGLPRSGYSSAVDMWSLGVILYICLVGYPPFADKLKHEKRIYTLRDQILQGIYFFPKQSWSRISPEAISLIKRMMVVDPAKRITAVEALEHPWLSQNKKLLEDVAACVKSAKTVVLTEHTDIMTQDLYEQSVTTKRHLEDEDDSMNMSGKRTKSK